VRGCRRQVRPEKKKSKRTKRHAYVSEETRALLAIVALGDAELAAGHVTPAREAFGRVRERIAAERARAGGGIGKTAKRVPPSASHGLISVLATSPVNGGGNMKSCLIFPPPLAGEGDPPKPRRRRVEGAWYRQM